MTKIETLTYEYEHCGDCPNIYGIADFPDSECACNKTRKIILDIWGDIPEWCPLETKTEKETVTISLSEMLREQRMRGRGEVVDYLNYVLINTNCVTVEDIKPKLKEWGIEGG